MTQQAEAAERQIRELIEAWAEAVRRHDIPGILAHHAQEIVMFDLPPPLLSTGMEAYRKTWDLFFAYHKPSQAFDVEELTITAGDDVAFAFGIMRCGAGAKPEGFPFRLTIGLRKIDGHWRVTHEHHSIPAVDG
ncbi:MAG TPA: nuclear transport factor 2 family protein [Xanthobacteraceae bacterium]|jgi:ketosteroid isomerase-like protein